MLTFFKPRPGRFEVVPVILTSGRINTGTLAAGTQTHTIGAHPAKCYISRVLISAGTYPTASSNNITLVRRTGATGTTTLNMTAAVDINAKTAGVSIPTPIASARTDAERILLPTDTLEVVLATGGTVTVQPDDLVVTVELLPLQ